MNFDRTVELTGLIGIFCIAQILKFQVPFYKKGPVKLMKQVKIAH